MNSNNILLKKRKQIQKEICQQIKNKQSPFHILKKLTRIYNSSLNIPLKEWIQIQNTSLWKEYQNSLNTPILNLSLMSSQKKSSLGIVNSIGKKLKFLLTNIGIGGLLSSFFGICFAGVCSAGLTMTFGGILVPFTTFILGTSVGWFFMNLSFFEKTILISIFTLVFTIIFQFFIKRFSCQYKLKILLKLLKKTSIQN